MPSRKRAVLMASIVLAAVSLLVLGRIPTPKSSDYSRALSAFTAKCPSSCPADPYATEGFLLSVNNHTESRWVPWSSALNLPQMRMKDLDPLGKHWWEDQTEAEARSATPFTRLIKERTVEDLHWARGKTVLIVGSSHDRGNVHQWCDVVGGSMNLWGGHIGGICTISWLDDLKIVSWFLTGMPDDTSDYPDWVGGDQRPLYFEGRIEQVIWPFMQESGLDNMQPDLITATSIMWDDSFLWHHGDIMQLSSRENGNEVYGLFYHELLWHRSRMVELIRWLKNKYGATTPMMYRTRHLREKNNHGGKIRVFQLDQSNRALSRELKLPLFSWGDKIEGYINYHDKDQHYGIGPQTYVFGDMLMFYLRQTILPGCWGCLQV